MLNFLNFFFILHKQLCPSQWRKLGSFCPPIPVVISVISTILSSHEAVTRRSQFPQHFSTCQVDKRPRTQLSSSPQHTQPPLCALPCWSCAARDVDTCKMAVSKQRMMCFCTELPENTVIVRVCRGGLWSATGLELCPRCSGAARLHFPLQIKSNNNLLINSVRRLNVMEKCYVKSETRLRWTPS